MTIRNDTDDNLVAEWQQVEIPNELRAPAHKHAALLVREALLVRDGKLVAGLSTEQGLFVTKLVPLAELREDRIRDLLAKRIARVYRYEMRAAAGELSDHAISGWPDGSVVAYWDLIREEFSSMSQRVLFERADFAIGRTIRNLGSDKSPGFVKLLLILSALRLDGRLDEWTIRGFLNYHVTAADYDVWRVIAMELLEPPTMTMPSENRFEVRRLLADLQPLADDAIRHELLQLARLRELNEKTSLLRGSLLHGRGRYAWSYLLDGLNYPWLDWIQLGVYRLANRGRYDHHRESQCLMWPHMTQLRKDLRQIYGARK